MTDEKKARPRVWWVERFENPVVHVGPDKPILWPDSRPLYDQAAIDVAVAAERERLLREVNDLHMCQATNNQNHQAAWHDGVDAAIEAIRAT